MQAIMVPIGVCENIEQIVRRFVWGSSERVNQPTLVNWDSCCLSKWLGGLGMNKLVP